MNTTNMLEETARAMSSKWPRKKLAELHFEDADEQMALEEDPNGATLVAAALGEWGVVHDLIEDGKSPNDAKGGAVDVPMLPWVDERLKEQIYSYNSNLLLLAAAGTADETVVRYLVARGSSFGATELGLALVPAVRVASDAADDAMWLLENMTLDESSFADAFSAVLYVAVNEDMCDVKDSLKALLVQRGIALGPLLYMYAQLPGVLHPRENGLDTDPDAAMAKIYQPADDAVIAELADALPGQAKGDLGALLPLACVERRWDVLHALVKRGVAPRSLAPENVARILKKVAKASGADPEMLRGAGMAALAADSGNVTALRYILAHGDALCVPKDSYIVLPAIAERAGHSWAAVWLMFHGLDLTIEQMQQAAGLAAQAAAVRGNICLIAMLFQAAKNCIDREDMHESCVSRIIGITLLAALDNEGLVRTVIEDSGLPRSLLAEAATIALESSDDADFGAYVLLLDAANLVSLNDQMEQFVSAINQGNQDTASRIIDAADENARQQLLRYAAVHAALSGQSALLKWLFESQNAIQTVALHDVDTVLLAAAMSKSSETLTVALAGLASSEDAFLDGAVATLRALVDEQRVSDAMAVLGAVADRPEAHDLAEIAVVAACVYGTAADLDIVLHTCVDMVPEEDRAWTFIAALEGALDGGSEAVAKVSLLLAVAEKHAEMYSMAARLAVVEAAAQSDAQTVRAVVATAKWPLPIERQAALCAAASAACERDDSSVLGVLLELAEPIDDETRLSWALNPETAKLVTDGVSTNALVDAACSPFTSSHMFELLQNALQSRELDGAQSQALEDAKARRASIEACVNEVRGVLEERLAAVFDAIFGDTEASDTASVFSASPLSINTEVLKERFESREGMPDASPIMRADSERDERPLL